LETEVSVVILINYTSRAMGDFVEKGELLGWIGASGTGFAHLHFQVCLRSGMCSYPLQEFTIPVNFNNADGQHDERGGLIHGIFYCAKQYR
jgi:murein DD-endopeptidase MepM/ murein hydrolase activator NlpD